MMSETKIEKKQTDVTNQLKRVDKLIDEVDKCYEKRCGNIHELSKELTTELKKLPILKPDEEIIECKKKTMESL